MKRIETSGQIWGSYYDYLRAGMAQSEDVDAEDLKADGEQRHVWKRSDDPKLVSYLENQAGLLAMVEEASKKPRWWVPTVCKDGELSYLSYPDLGSVRHVADVLCARAMMRAGERDAARFMEDVGTIKRLARLVAGGPTFLEQMISVGIEGDLNRMVGAAVGAGVFTEQQCVEIGKMYDGFGELPATAEVVDQFERWGLLDFTQCLAARRGTRNQYLIASVKTELQTIEWEEVDWNQVLKRINRHYDELTAAARMAVYGDSNKKLWELQRQMETWMVVTGDEHGAELNRLGGETKAAYSERVAETILSVMAGWYGRCDELHRWVRMEREMIDVLLAAAEEKGRTGKWPVEVKGLPRDMYSVGGQEVVKYVVRAAGAEIYSVGPNGKDDGGIRGGEKRADDAGVGAVPEVEGGK